jgi:hypothetical protein
MQFDVRPEDSTRWTVAGRIVKGVGLCDGIGRCVSLCTSKSAPRTLRGGQYQVGWW